MIILKTPEEIEKLRTANLIVARTLAKLKKMIEAGVTTLELDSEAEKAVRAEGARPSFKGYKGFPNALCASVNHEVVHGIPSNRKLKNGDIVKLDLGTEYEGYYGDAAVSVAVGKVSDRARKLMETTKEALNKGIEQARAGNHLSDISHAVGSFAESRGFSVVKDYVGHGIGKRLHQKPQIPCFLDKPINKSPLLKKGQTLAIEVIYMEGKPDIELDNSDNWTMRTKDNSRSAMFEHTVAIVSNKPLVLTL